MMELLEERIGTFGVEFKLEGLPAPWIAYGKKALLDGTGAFLSGVKKRQAALLKKTMEAAGEKEPFPVWDEVFLWAAAAHSTEYNDMYDELPGHPGVVLIPAALVVGNHQKARIREVLEAYMAGFEVAARVNQLLLPVHHEKGFHSTCVSGIAGSAITAGKLLGLDKEQLSAALGFALSFAGGLRKNFGTDGNTMQVARSSADGVKAAFLAREGLKTAGDLLDGEGSFFEAFHGREREAESLFETLGKENAFLNPGIRIKKYPACFSVYQAVDAALLITGLSEYDWNKIEQVICLTSEHSYHSLTIQNPKDSYAKRFCVPYCVLAALYRGKLDEESFREDGEEPEKFRELLNRMEYGVHEELKGKRGYGFTEVTVLLKDGTRLVRRSFPDKQERIENVSLSALEENSRCAGEALSKEDVEKIKSLLFKADEEIPVSGLYRLLAGAWKEERI